MNNSHVKRWCGRSAAGTESAAMNPMVEWHGDPDEDTPYVLASDYDALEREVAELREKAARLAVEMNMVADGLEEAINYATTLGEKYTNDHAVGYMQSAIGSWIPRLRGALKPHAQERSEPKA